MKANVTFLNILKTHPHWPAVETTLEKLNKAGYLAFLAGGCVRDALLGVQPHDFDIATNATPEQVETLFERTIGVGKKFGVMLVVHKADSALNGIQIEVATFRTDGLYRDGRRPETIEFSDPPTDAARRDFTINALFFDHSASEILDFNSGIEDLRLKLIRAVGDANRRFNEDQLRMLRAVRFESQLGFTIAPETRAAIVLNARKVVGVSRERIRDELDKLLLGRDYVRALDDIEQLQLGPAVFGDWFDFIFSTASVYRRPFAVNHDLEVRRLLLFWPAVVATPRERLHDQLLNWKYGRSFIDLSVWLKANMNTLRVSSTDPVTKLFSREERVTRFAHFVYGEGGESVLERQYSPFELDWMVAFELWRDVKAVKGCAVLDAVCGTNVQTDMKRDEALARRGRTLGVADPNTHVTATELLAIAARYGKVPAGATLGLHLRWLTRDLLLFTGR